MKWIDLSPTFLLSRKNALPMRGMVDLFSDSILVDDSGNDMNIDGDALVRPIKDGDDDDAGDGAVVLLLVTK